MYASIISLFTITHNSIYVAGIHDYCIDRELRFGFSTNRPCLYLHIAKVIFSLTLFFSTVA